MQGCSSDEQELHSIDQDNDQTGAAGTAVRVQGPLYRRPSSAEMSEYTLRRVGRASVKGPDYLEEWEFRRPDQADHQLADTAKVPVRGGQARQRSYQHRSGPAEETVVTLRWRQRTGFGFDW